jgi:hypothetical protein
MRFFTAMLTAGLLALPALDADAAEAAGSARKTGQSGPLKPGRSAGVRAAQLPRTGLALVGASAVIAIVAVAASSGGGGSGGNGPQLQSVPTTTP